MSHELLPLHCLAPGQKAYVSQFCGSGEQIERMQAMGVREGAEIEVVKSGSPCIIRVENCQLCFRESEALCVLVALGEIV